MVPKKPPRIEFGTSEMFRAWADGVECYDPTFRGRKIESEGGVTDASLCALRKIITAIGRQPDSIVIGPEGNCLFSFGDFGCYLATGFSIGYRGEGPTGLAEIAAECGFGSKDDCRAKVESWESHRQGVIFAQTADYGPIFEREEAIA